MFKKILIANRGNFALRILRACKEMEIPTVAIHSTADSQSMHVLLADESVCIGNPRPIDSYLNISAILSAAEITGADAIHPGIGFLAENAKFAEMVEEHGLTFIGPNPSHIHLMGNKITAKNTAQKLKIPVVPGYQGESQDSNKMLKEAKNIGFPVLIKAASGGGGRGMKISYHESDFLDNLSLCKQEAQTTFGDATVYLEKFLAGPKHIEFQVLSDGKFSVTLGERDCSMQRRHQKIIEESPAPTITHKERNSMINVINKAMEKIGYLGVGTLEFLYENHQFYFIEMNTRLQVEHPVSEAVYNIDIVKEQIRIAAGRKLPYKQKDMQITGHAIECRINAEDPWTLMPSPGKIIDYLPPGGRGIRIESSAYPGYIIPPYYDNLVSQLIVHGEDRKEALEKMRNSLKEFVLSGISNNIPLFQKILEYSSFLHGQYSIKWLENTILNNLTP